MYNFVRKCIILAKNNVMSVLAPIWPSPVCHVWRWAKLLLSMLGVSILSGGFRGVRLVMYFCEHNCMSSSNDYTAVACSNNSLTHLHTHVSVPYRSPDAWLCLELLQDIQFGLLRDRKWAWQPKNFQVCFAHQWLNPPFWISESATDPRHLPTKCTIHFHAMHLSTT